MHLSDQPLAQRQRRQAIQSVLECPNVVEDLPLVLGLDEELRFSGEHVRERGLRSFDPRARNGLPAEVRPDQKVGIREASSEPGQCAHSAVSFGELEDGAPGELDLARQRLRREGPVGGVALSNANRASNLRSGVARRVHDKKLTISLAVPPRMTSCLAY